MAIDIRGLASLLQVFDMPTSIKFYCEVLGFEIVSTDWKDRTPVRLGTPPAECCGIDAEHGVPGARASVRP
jgi:hypothetical protein